MAIPIQFYVKNVPTDRPESVQELLNSIGGSLGTSFTPGTNYILGQMGGVLPQGNVGPWANDNTWWFYNPATGAYDRGFDGVPIGVMVWWGGQGAPNNFLICDGSEVPINQYLKLYQTIGTDWGAGDGVTTFNLPPGAYFYISDGHFYADPVVPITPSVSNENAQRRGGWGVRGGSQVAPLITPANLPPLDVTISFSLAGVQTPGPANMTMLYPSTATSQQLLPFQILDSNGTELQKFSQTQFSCMPPFAAANLIIKYQ